MEEVICAIFKGLIIGLAAGVGASLGIRSAIKSQERKHRNDRY